MEPFARAQHYSSLHVVQLSIMMANLRLSHSVCVQFVSSSV